MAAVDETGILWLCVDGNIVGAGDIMFFVQELKVKAQEHLTSDRVAASWILMIFKLVLRVYFKYRYGQACKSLKALWQ